ncbi:MAG: hypothetical protein PHW69_06830 [Elusimicrobiaceae bacterium]|nr:hypothetical protein [Elusimicrobiaceae bacterium]
MPAIFLLPTLWLFVILLLETAKLSRAKIKYQLAADVAATVEMENYADFFNRTAYVNGAFPYRIFAENYEDCKVSNGNTVALAKKSLTTRVSVCLHDLLLANGTYPTWVKDDNPQGDNFTNGARLYEDIDDDFVDTRKKWLIQFVGAHGYGTRTGNGTYDMQSYDGKTNVDNWNRPYFGPNDWKEYDYMFRDRNHFIGAASLDCVNAKEWNTNCPYTALETYVTFDTVKLHFDFWFQVYALLGNVSNSQTAVFKTLIENHAFFRKAYYYNAGDCTESPGGNSVTDEDVCLQSGGQSGLSGDNGARAIGSAVFETEAKELTTTTFFYSKAKADISELRPIYRQTLVYGDSTDVQPRLFQLRVFKEAELDKLKTLGDGLDVYQIWVAENNFFDINVNALGSGQNCGDRLCVHNKVSVRSSIFGEHGGGDNNTVWPYPTPKYQVVLDP